MMQAHSAYQTYTGQLDACATSKPATMSVAGAPDDLLCHTRNQLILEELPQVHFIASRILEKLPPGVELEDLVHAGVLGLLEAYEHYDHTRNAQFKTFASFRIRGAILDSLRLLDWGSRGVRKKAREIAEVSSRLQAALGRKPEREEIADAMHITLEQLHAAMSQLDSLQIVSQHTTVPGEDGAMLDLIESAPSPEANPFDLCLRGEQRQHLVQAIAALNPREQLVLSLYYREELTMKEVAEVVGIALSRVSQIHQAALSKLRETLQTLRARPLPGPTLVPTLAAQSEVTPMSVRGSL